VRFLDRYPQSSKSVCVVAGTQNRHEDLTFSNLSGVRINNRQCVPGVVDKKLLPGFMGLPHGDLQFFLPAPIDFTILAVAVSLRKVLLILLPEQHQGDALAFKLGVNCRAVGALLLCGNSGMRYRKQLIVQLLVSELFWKRPLKPAALVRCR